MQRREFVKSALWGMPAVASLSGCQTLQSSGRQGSTLEDLRDKAKPAMLCTQRQPWEQGVAMMALLEPDDQILIVLYE